MTLDPIEYIARALTDPIVVFPPAYGDDVPESLKEYIQTERLLQLLKEDPPIEEATDAEALAYLMTASYAAPLSHDWQAIYLHLASKYAKSQGLQLPEDLQDIMERYRELEPHQEEELSRLKSWIQRQKDKHYRERRRSYREQRASKNPEQLALDLFEE